MKQLATQVLIVGAGPAGMAAAVRSRECGEEVLVLDDNAGPGGQIWRGGVENRWFRRFRELAIDFVPYTQVIAADREARTVLAETSNSAFEIQFEKLILATGAREVFLPFPNWTLPGIMGVGGLQALVKSGLPLEDKRVVLAGSGPLLLAVAANLRHAGANVRIIAEQASFTALRPFLLHLVREPAKLLQGAALRMRLLGVPYRFGCWVERAEGEGKLQAIHLRQGARRWIEPCDYAGIGYGLYPNNELANLLGCRLDGSRVIVDDYGETSLPGVYCAGEPTGIGGVDAALVEGEIAGFAAYGNTEAANALQNRRASGQRFARALDSAFALRAELRTLPAPDTTVCRCEDVSYGQLQNSSSFRAAKLHTRFGMGPCQGRICGAAAGFLFGWRTESIRPPIFPARLGTLIGSPQSGNEKLLAKETSASQ